MARIDAGTVTLDEDEVSLGEVAEQAIAALEEEMPSHGRAIKIHDENRELCVRADRARLRQILTHLLSNAAKFSETDTIIDVEFMRDADGVSIVVRDRGAGISPEKLALVLEPFGQVESVYSRSQGGIGLGLPLVKSLVEMHGGTFTLSSRPGAGTEARIHLPTSRILAANLHSLVLAT
jgi:signal transduction histidine kinase